MPWVFCPPGPTCQERIFLRTVGLGGQGSIGPAFKQGRDPSGLGHFRRCPKKPHNFSHLHILQGDPLRRGGFSENRKLSIPREIQKNPHTPTTHSSGKQAKQWPVLPSWLYPFQGTCIDARPTKRQTMLPRMADAEKKGRYRFRFVGEQTTISGPLTYFECQNATDLVVYEWFISEGLGMNAKLEGRGRR